MNLIFDIGNVIVNFKPMEALIEWGFEKDAKALFELIFASHEWNMLDKGTLTRKEAEFIFNERAPMLKDEIAYIMEHWIEILTPKQDVAIEIARLKEQGHGLYYLSNFPEQAHEYAFANPTFKLFDGGVLSYMVKLVKPEREIFELLLSRYHLAPESCLFFDDLPHNVEGARAVGINAVQFTGVSDIAASLPR